MARGEQRGGRAFKFGDDVSTDLITAGRHMHLRGDLAALAEHAMEDADPTFARRVRPGDYLVAGENFGMGSSREHAPLVLKQKGVAAVIARSVARIFFRNAINVGLPVLICDTAAIGDGDRLRVDLREGLVVDETTGAALRASPMPSIMLRVLQEGGLKPFIRTHGGFDVLAEDPPARARPDRREPRQDPPV